MILSFVAFAVMSSPAFMPSRSTVMRSVISSISSSLWEMKTTEMPCFFKSRTIAKRLSTSEAASDEVGSSIISNFVSYERALAISTICCFATPSFLTSVSGLMSIFRRVNSAVAFSRILA